jgi:hypothetical protein
MNYSRLLALIGMVLSVSLFRLLPHPPNFTPILAVALFAGAQFTDRRLALLVPLLAMLAADLLLGLHATLPFVYGAIALIVILGMWLKKRLSVTWTATTAVSGSMLFYIITNFGAWLTMPELYARSIEGLLTAYIAAIPFYQTMLAGDLFYTAVLFGGFFLLERRFPRLVEPVSV